MLGVTPHRAVTRTIKGSATLALELPAPASGVATCRYVQLVSSGPAIIKLSEKPIEAKDKDGKDVSVAVNVGEDGVIYLPPNVPITVTSGQRWLYVRSLDKDAIFCAAPMSSM